MILIYRALLSLFLYISLVFFSARASFSQKGLSGEVTFTQINQYVEVKVNISGVGNDEFNWEIRSLPVDVTVEEDCDESYLGNV